MVTRTLFSADPQFRRQRRPILCVAIRVSFNRAPRKCTFALPASDQTQIAHAEQEDEYGSDKRSCHQAYTRAVPEAVRN